MKKQEKKCILWKEERKTLATPTAALRLCCCIADLCVCVSVSVLGWQSLGTQCTYMCVWGRVLCVLAPNIQMLDSTGHSSDLMKIKTLNYRKSLLPIIFTVLGYSYSLQCSCRSIIHHSQLFGNLSLYYQTCLNMEHFKKHVFILSGSFMEWMNLIHLRTVTSKEDVCVCCVCVVCAWVSVGVCWCWCHV